MAEAVLVLARPLDQSLSLALDQCDCEIALYREVVVRDEGWLMALKDWYAERSFIKIEQLVQDALRTEPGPEQYAAALERLRDTRTLRLLHVAMGLATEAGEFVDMLKRHIFYGTPVDATNAIEELGDVSWYQRVGCDALEVGFAELLARNVAKLRVRFPEKFEERKAVERDLAVERNVLDGLSDEEKVRETFNRMS